MIRSIAYGSDREGNFFVQTCCNEEHLGQECGCKNIGEHFTKDEARILAEQKSNDLNVPLEFWS